VNKNLIAFAIGFAFAYALGSVALRAYSAETDRMYQESDQLSPAAVNLVAMTMPEPEPVNPWQRVKITTYGPGYHGKLTNSGERFSDHKLTAAAPVKGKTKGGRHIPSIPFGTYVEVRYGARSVVVKINDTCIGGTLDLSRAAMTELLGRYEETTLKGEFRVVR
jgi:rare lipoprotein A (peptidoglycan hydrolase)